MSTWHPINDAVEGPTGAWHLADETGARMGRIELRRVMNGSDLRYRVEFRGDVIGWATSLRTACERLNQAFVSTHGPGGGAVASWEGPRTDARGKRSESAAAGDNRGRPAAERATSTHDEGGRPRGRPPSPG